MIESFLSFKGILYLHPTAHAPTQNPNDKNGNPYWLISCVNYSGGENRLWDEYILLYCFRGCVFKNCNPAFLGNGDKIKVWGNVGVDSGNALVLQARRISLLKKNMTRKKVTYNR